MKTALILVVALFAAKLSFCQDSMICKTPSKDHEVCEFDNGDVIETWTTPGHYREIRYHKTTTVLDQVEEQRAEDLGKYLRQGMSLTEADQAAHDEMVRQEAPGVLKARITMCHSPADPLFQSMKSNGRCEGLLAPVITSASPQLAPE
jgi:hypothetical protein